MKFICRVSQKTLFQKIFIIVLSGAYSQLVTILIQFIQIPLFLKFWNKEVYTDWLIITGLPTLLTLLDLGICQASASKATMDAAKDQWQEAKRSLNTALMFTSVLSALLILVVVLTNQFTDVANLFRLVHFSNHDAELILLIMTLHVALNLHGGPTEIHFRTINKAAYGTFLNANRRVIDFLLGVTVLFVGCNGVTLACTLLVGQMIYFSWIIYETKKNDAHKLLSYSNASWVEFKSILKPSIAYMGFPISQIITTQGGVQLLNAFGSAYLVVPFTMARTLVRTTIQIAMVLNNALKPELSRLIGSGQKAEAEKFTRKTSLYASAFALIWYSILIIIGPWIVDSWSNHQTSVTRTMVAMVGLHALCNVFWFVSAAYSIAGNQHTALSKVYSTTAVSAMILWVLCKDMIAPIYGVCIMMLLPEIAAWLHSYYATRNKASKVSLVGI